MAKVTIHNQNRPCHIYRIHTDANQNPSSAVCDCGAGWHPGGNQSVADWGLTHTQPSPIPDYDRVRVAHRRRTGG